MPPTKAFDAQSPCPCGNQQPLMTCCLPFLSRQTTAPTAESLMRSRYTAHVLLNIDYLWETWSPKQRMHSSPEDILAWASSCQWLDLQILTTHAGQPEDDEGKVVFVATYRQNGTVQQHHEISLFKKIAGSWLYVDHVAP